MIFEHQESAEIFAKAIGKTIVGLEIKDNQLQFMFSDGYRIALFDEVKSWYECRYMNCDDNLVEFIGSTLAGAEIKDGPTEQVWLHGVKDSQFLVVSTSTGQFTVCNYNEHSGYYTGFELRAKETR